jgi:hypothetical protein
MSEILLKYKKYVTRDTFDIWTRGSLQYCDFDSLFIKIAKAIASTILVKNNTLIVIPGSFAETPGIYSRKREEDDREQAIAEKVFYKYFRR